MMRKLLIRKTSALIVSLMIVSALMPIAAFADAWFTKPTSSYGNVSGSVYVDSTVYGALGANKDKVSIVVYSGDDYVGTIDAAYNAFSGAAAGHYYYDFNVPRNSFSSYTNLKFGFYDTTVASGTYFWSEEVTRDLSNPIGIGGGGIIPPTGGEITPWADGRVDATELAAALQDGSATIRITGDFAILPASALTAGGTVTIVTADGTTYTLPLSLLDLEALARSLGVELADLEIRIGIEVLADAALGAVTNAAAAVGGTRVADAIEFNVFAVGGGKEVEVNFFGNTYINRSLILDKVVAPSQVTAVTFDPATGGLSFVPATFATADGVTTATIKRTGNSIYTVIELDAKSFRDLAGHWSQEEVEALAAKLVVEGTSATTFEPRRAITRAEFAAMIVRSLGLEASGTSAFTDVSSDRWYAGAVAAASEAGIINGYPDGTFKPTENISRKELAAMVVRAMEFAGKGATLTPAQANAALSAFTDAGNLGWAKAEVAAAVQSGIVNGVSATRVAGDSTANRAEAAAMVLRFLSEVDFIN